MKKISTCTIEESGELNEPEALADFQWRGSASASGSMEYLGKLKLNRTGRKISSHRRKFVHPHDACFDNKGNIYVAEWVQTGRVTKLK